MAFFKVFFNNICLLIALAYLFNLGYKTMFSRLSDTAKEYAAIVMFIAAGWLTMLFGLRLSDNALFDLRFIPLIMAVLVFNSAPTIFVIGLGIGLGRLFFGVGEAAWAGVANMAILGLAGALLHVVLKKSKLRFLWQAGASIAVINTLNCLNISLLGVIPFRYYWEHIAGLTLLPALVLSAFFVYMIRDFHKEQLRFGEMRNMNLILRRQTKALREAKRELEEKARQLMLASRYKSEFLANMSHELKTPLNSILLISQLIRENEEREYGEEDVRHAGIIYTAGHELLHLIEDILDLSKVEAGKMDVNPEPTSPHELVHTIQCQFMPVAERSGVQFKVAVDSDVPHTIETDALRASQIVRNLLTNAFKFTEQGSVELSVFADKRKEKGALPAHSQRGKGRGWGQFRFQRNERPVVNIQPVTAAEPEWVGFSVKDTGIGIDKEKQSLIFEAFQQEDGAVTRKYGGTGLGLSISLQLSRLLGGKLELKSEKGKGSVFTLRLPVKYSAPVPQLTDQNGPHHQKEPDHAG
ncbi:sensor histidine kinase [Paenibacillus beijingensis]|uniref:ATP-binding protein n=1 Tax=Paenibacillus beijingensis TaxID=1126833 RepID=UPI000696D652|nr:ATP-binding protein [Paenibacillus beijingensis]